jgi:chromosomal replication initiation ATPase DnaA
MSLISVDELTALFQAHYFRTRQVRNAMVMIEATIEARLRKRARARNDAEARKPAHCAPALHPVVTALARFWGVRPMAVVGPSRVADVLQARYEAAWVLRAMGLSYPVIGSILRRDHTSVLMAVRKMERLLATDDVRRARLRALVAPVAMVAA